MTVWIIFPSSVYLRYNRFLGNVLYSALLHLVPFKYFYFVLEDAGIELGIVVEYAF
jgi:hypothetical protein